jgi:hypothetical protein
MVARRDDWTYFHNPEPIYAERYEVSPIYEVSSIYEVSPIEVRIAGFDERVDREEVKLVTTEHTTHPAEITPLSEMDMTRATACSLVSCLCLAVLGSIQFHHEL